MATKPIQVEMFDNNVQDVMINETNLINDSDKLSALRRLLSEHVELLQKQLYDTDDKIEEVSTDLVKIRDGLASIDSEEKRKDAVGAMMQKDTIRNNHIYSKKLYKEEITALQLILKNTF